MELIILILLIFITIVPITILSYIYVKPLESNEYDKELEIEEIEEKCCCGGCNDCKYSINII
jgi:hypothetical protein